MTGTVIWKRRQGEWCLYGPAAVIAKGATVTVAKRSGETSQEHIAEVYRATAVDGVKMAYGLPGGPILTEDDAEAMEREAREQEARQLAEGCQVELFCSGRCADAAEHEAYRAGKAAVPLPSIPAGMCEACGTRRAAHTITDRNGMTGRVCRSCGSDPELTIH
jgi:hypothetical protein